MNPNSHVYGLKLYDKMREVDCIDNWYIELHSYYPCNNKEELIKREGEVMREIATLNSIVGEKTYVRKQKKKLKITKNNNGRLRTDPQLLNITKNIMNAINKGSKK
jgi:hypothetical protein